LKAGILCAVERELAPFLPHIEGRETSKKALLSFHAGRIHGVDVVVFLSGVCKTNAAIAAQIAIDTYGVDIMINAGTAGGMQEDVALFDTIIGTEVVHHDVAEAILTAFHPYLSSAYFKADEKLLALSKEALKALPPTYVVRYGRMVSGEQFITDEGRDVINAKFEPLTVDMETASVAQVCHANEIPFIAIRAVTDTADHSGADNFEKNCEAASAISKDVVLALLKEIGTAAF